MFMITRCMAPVKGICAKNSILLKLIKQTAKRKKFADLFCRKGAI